MEETSEHSESGTSTRSGGTSEENAPSDALPKSRGRLLPPSSPQPVWKWIAFCAFLVLFTGVYFFFADLLIRQTNQDRSKSDQQNNLTQALRQSEIEFDAGEGWVEGARRMLPHHTDGVVQPLWPWVASHFAGDGEEEFFTRGKWLNVALTLMFCLLLGLAVFRRFSFFGAVNVVLLAGFVVFLPRAVFFQPEPIFYILFFLSWLCCCSLLERHSIWMYFLLGLLAGLGYLAKSSVQPMLGAFALLVVFLLVEQVFLKGRRMGRSAIRALDAPAPRPVLGTMVGLLLMASMFLVTVSPLTVTAKERWGSGFHTYPSYWMWMDSFEEGINFKVAHPGKAELDAIPSADRPSASRYWREHTGRQVWSRLADGVWRKSSLFAAPKRIDQKKKRKDWKPWKHLLPDRGGYLAALLVLLSVAASVLLVTRRRGARDDLPGHRGSRAGGALVLFTAGTAIMFALAYGWYTPIGRGDRFMMSLYLPLAFMLILGIERSVSMLVRRRVAPRSVVAAHLALQFALSAWMVWRLTAVASFPYFQDSV